MRLVDTNIFLRFLVNDIPQQADACEAVFRKAVAGEEALYTTDMVVAEIVWVLESYYELPRSDIRAKLEKILNTPNVTFDNKETIIHALVLYEEKGIDYIDAYNACIIRMKGIGEIYSYDKHYDRLSWLKRIEPEHTDN
jgi:predicted nucleic acid-binding protein